ncbi:hypothetical protein M0813_07052 [Anaeramoeba flamelloides]|uniref:Uncharacterized protein n=1 Tax=Anaeramoeba flamelloides TaxID=1746091 RepID=A0ABQ8XCN3_9EUKA|nr:hypothetical protein M0813_07052 [Anaeramoeba flamelloides]
MGLDYGKCSSYNNMPPSKQTSNQEATGDADRSETFRLCCINSPRGDGVHCLRYDYSSKYLSYSIGKPFVTHQLNMLLEKNSLQYETISLSKFDNTKESQEENDDWEAELMITQGDPDCSDKLQHFSDSYYFFQETNIAFENEYYRWFLIKKNDESINKINLDPLTFSLLASCEDEYHSQTRTHYEDDTTDQFQVWRQFRIDNFLTEIQNSVNVDNEIQVIQDQNNQPKNMRIQFSQNPENSLVKIILKNIITKQ